MERMIEIDEDLSLPAAISPECADCPAIDGEVRILVESLRKQGFGPGSNSRIEVECHAGPGRKNNERHINIKIRLPGGESCSTDDFVRGGTNRIVQCGRFT